MQKGIGFIKAAHLACTSTHTPHINRVVGQLGPVFCDVYLNFVDLSQSLIKNRYITQPTQTMLPNVTTRNAPFYYTCDIYQGFVSLACHFSGILILASRNKTLNMGIWASNDVRYI